MSNTSIRWRAQRRTIAPPPTEDVRKKVLDRVRGDRWGDELGAGVSAGLVGGPWVDGLPRYVWHRAGDTVVEFRLVAPPRARYTRYELHPSEWPEGIA